MTQVRRDVARNRERIVVAARELRSEGQPLQLNAVARRAEVGVATVYRHFATPEALAEGLIEHRFGELADAARAAAHDPDAGEALRRFLGDSLRVYVADPTFAAAVTTTNPALEETRLQRAELMKEFSGLLERASSDLRPGIEPVDLMILICGLAYSARLRPDRVDLYLDALIGGVLA